MKFTHILYLLIASLLAASCNSTKKLARRNGNTKQLSEQLNIQVTPKDDIPLYTASAKWLGVPYRYGGNTQKGVDCSGLVCALYKEVYHTQLERTAAGMYQKNCRKISRNNLKPGDLVFFNTAKTKKSVSHVGILLKDGVFIHSTTSSGVRTSHIDEKYYKKRWINGGRVKK